MFHHLCNQIEQQVKKIYFDSNLNELFEVLPSTHNKIITCVVQQCIKYNLFSEGELKLPTEIPGQNWRSDILAFALNLAIFAFSISKYSLVPLLFRMIVKNNRCFFSAKKDLKFIFINSAGGVDRLASIIRGNFHQDKYLMLYLFTSFPRKIMKRLKIKPGINFIPPRLPSRKALQKCFLFLFKNGHKFTLRLLFSLSRYPVSLRHQVVASTVQYVYALLIYHLWAKESALNLAASYPKALFIFDLDEAGKELLLADCLNRLGKRTLLIQHGILTDPKRYIPTCSFMACSSEREKQALISEGVDSKRLYVTGQALQTIKDSTLYTQTNNSVYPILILAGAGPKWLQRLYINMLKGSHYLGSYQQAFMRIHPAMAIKEKKIWYFDRNKNPTAEEESLGDCIAKSHVVITFSIDALIVAVRQQHPTIVCIPEKFFAPTWHNFLEAIPMVRIAKTSAVLDAILADKNFWNSCKHDYAESQWEYVEYAFGSLYTQNNLTKLLDQLVSEKQT